MKIIDDGIIKYDNTDFTQAGPIPFSDFKEIEKHRKILHQIKLIGAYNEGAVGYGNISYRRNYLEFLKTPKPQFLITGTQTGLLKNLTGEHYTRVINYDIEKFKIFTHGPIQASSESLTHGAIYEANQEINEIIHIHSKEIWSGLIDDSGPSTAENIPYGSFEMALAVKECIKNSNKNYFVMKGHDEGVVIYGASLDLALNQTIKLYQKYIDSNFTV